MPGLPHPHPFVFRLSCLIAAAVAGWTLLSDGFPFTPEESLIELRGFVVCLDAVTGEPISESGLDCGQSSLQFGFQTRDGATYSFIPGDPRVPIFGDPRVRGRFLRIIARLTEGRQVEIIHLHAVEAGKLVKLYYRCDVCNIDAYAPGPCWCCQQPFEFREKVESEDASFDPQFQAAS